MKYLKLRKTMAEKNLSTRQVALKAGITPQGLYAAINGKCEFWPGWRKRVADALGVAEAELFDDDETE